MKLIKKLIVLLTAIVLTLTVSACTISEADLNSILNELTSVSATSVNSGAVTSNDYPKTSGNSTNSSANTFVPPTITNSTQVISNSFSYDFSVYNEYYVKSQPIIGFTKLNEHITLTDNATFITSSGKTYTDENVKFTGAWQLSKNEQIDYLHSKSMFITIPSSGYLSLYVSIGSTSITEAYFNLTDISNNSTKELTFFNETHTINKITVFLDKASVYAMYTNGDVPSVNVWGVCFSQNPNQKISADTHTSVPTPTPILPKNSSSKITSSAITASSSRPMTSYLTTSLYSFETALAQYENGYIFNETTDVKPFKVMTGTRVRVSTGKTAKNGSAYGKIFTYALQIPKNGTFDNKSLQLTTTGYRQIEIYTTTGSSAVYSAELYVIDSNNSIVDTITITSELQCNILSLPDAGTYALVAPEVSSINVWGLTFITKTNLDPGYYVSASSSSNVSDGSEITSAPTVNDGTTTYEDLLEEAIKRYEDMLLNGASQEQLSAQLAYIEALKTCANQ